MEFIERSYEKHEAGYRDNFVNSERKTIALGLNLPFFIDKGLNVCYFLGVEFEKAIANSRVYKKVKGRSPSTTF